MSKKKEEKHYIDPMKTPVFMDVEDIKILKLQVAVGVINPKEIVGKMINTMQYLHEVIERMEEHQDWFTINAPEELMDKYMIEVMGWTDKDFKESDEAAKRVQEKAFKLFKKLRDESKTK